MKLAILIPGIVLIALAVMGFTFGRVSFTHEKRVVDIGPVQIDHRQTDTLPITPVAGAIALIAGIGLVVVGIRSR